MHDRQQIASGRVFREATVARRDHDHGAPSASGTKSQRIKHAVGRREIDTDMVRAVEIGVAHQLPQPGGIIVRQVPFDAAVGVAHRLALEEGGPRVNMIVKLSGKRSGTACSGSGVR